MAARSIAGAGALAAVLLSACGAVATAAPRRDSLAGAARQADAAQHASAAAAADGASQWNHIAAGAYFSCGIQLGNTLWCWGANEAGQLGVGNLLSQFRPQQVTTPAATGWASITVGGENACATRGDATLWCWGYNGLGELGIGTTTGQDLPQQISP